MMKKLLAICVFGSCLFVTMAMAHDTQMRKSMYSDLRWNICKAIKCYAARKMRRTVKDVDMVGVRWHDLRNNAD